MTNLEKINKIAEKESEIQNKTAAKKIIVQPEAGNKASRNTLLSAG